MTPRAIIAILAAMLMCAAAQAADETAGATAHAALGRDLARTAKTAADFFAAAQEFARASQAAPSVAEYYFRRGELLQKAGLNAAAADAFALYLATAPGAKDSVQVTALIAALRRLPATDANAAVALPSIGDGFRDCPECPEMVAIPGGRFKMGSPRDEDGRFDSEGPQHDVTVSAFAFAKYEVTEKDFSLFLAETGYQPAPCDKILDKSWRSPGHGLVFPPGTADLPEQPAVCLNWHDVNAYVAWLNKKLRAAKPTAAPYRLPSEAEWEYAARGGIAASRWWGEGVGIANANCHGCGSKWDNTLIAPTGSFGPNPFGLYDMLGNVWQWTADCWNENYMGAPTDGGPWTTGDCGKRVIRGGSWSNLPVFIRAAARSRADVGGKDFDFSSYAGFRLARSLK